MSEVLVLLWSFTAKRADTDYPPVSGREGYRNTLQGVAQHPAFANPMDREWVMGKTALGVFGL